MAAGDKPLSVLLRDGPHATASIRLALKVEQFSISISRSPIHVATAQHEGLLLDMGINRPSITLSGVISNVGDDTTNLTSISGEKAGYQGMEVIPITGPSHALNSANTITFNNTLNYYVPYKNYLESVTTGWSTATGDNPEIEVGDASFPLYNILGNGDSSDGTSGYNISQNDHAVTGSITKLTQLNEYVDASEDDIDLDSTAHIQKGNHILIDSEVMKVNSISGNTINVERDERGTAAAPHDDDTPVYGYVNHATGGSIYEVSFVNVQFSLIPGMEDRWMYTMQMSALVPPYVFD